MGSIPGLHLEIRDKISVKNQESHNWSGKHVFFGVFVFVFLPGGLGVPRRWKILPVSLIDRCPHFLTTCRACTQLSFVPENFKNVTSFFSQFWFTLQLITASESSIVCLKHQNLLHEFHWGGGIFGLSGQLSKSSIILLHPRSKSPQSDSIPNGDRKSSPKASSPPPLKKKFCEKNPPGARVLLVC